MNTITKAIICQIDAISEFAELDNLCTTDFREIHGAARGLCRALERAINRAEDRETVLRKYGYLPPEGGDAA